MRVCLAFVPVLLFLAALVRMDTFKLVGRRDLLAALMWGALAAFIVMPSHDVIAAAVDISPRGFTRYVGPVIEESVKGIFIVVLIGRRRIGFLVDATILGFAIGTGFSVVENLAYLQALGNAPVLLWVVRGLGTAILHGGTTAILAMMTKRAADGRPDRPARAWLPGWLVAVSIHSAFNHVLVPAVAQAALLTLLLPLIVLYIFQHSERSTREWVREGLDREVALLQLMESEELAGTRVGEYLHRLRSRFPGWVTADMYCLLRIELELSAQAKGLLLARDAGLELPEDDELAPCLAEREYLLRSIGTMGRLALNPLCVAGDRDEWHRRLLRQHRGG